MSHLLFLLDDLRAVSCLRSWWCHGGCGGEVRDTRGVLRPGILRPGVLSKALPSPLPADPAQQVPASGSGCGGRPRGSASAQHVPPVRSVVAGDVPGAVAARGGAPAIKKCKLGDLLGREKVP